MELIKPWKRSAAAPGGRLLLQAALILALGLLSLLPGSTAAAQDTGGGDGRLVNGLLTACGLLSCGDDSLFAGGNRKVIASSRGSGEIDRSCCADLGLALADARRSGGRTLNCVCGELDGSLDLEGAIALGHVCDEVAELGKACAPVRKAAEEARRREETLVVVGKAKAGPGRR